MPVKIKYNCTECKGESDVSNDTCMYCNEKYLQRTLGCKHVSQLIWKQYHYLRAKEH